MERFRALVACAPDGFENRRTIGRSSPGLRDGIEVRLSALETEVKRLRELIENGHNNG
jgi:hypothetical protein